MSNKENLFNSFSAVSKAEWLEKVTTDLKGKPLESLHWKVGKELNLSPFYHSDDHFNSFDNLSTGENNDWSIGEEFDVKDLKTTNKLLLKSLQMGVNAPVIKIDKLLSVADLKQVFESVEFEYISTHFKVASDIQLDQLKNFHQLLIEQGSNINKVFGSINGSDRTSFELAQFAMENLTGFQILEITTHESDETASLADMMTRANNHIVVLLDKGLSIDQINQLIQFRVALGTTYFVEIAKIRALKLLWQNVLNAYGATNVSQIKITAELSPKTHASSDPNTNMIRSTTQAMSAVIGGVDILSVLPSDSQEQGGVTDFSRRIARNVQHLLKMESYLDQVADPAAGSYYIEHITNVLAESAWEKFQNLS